MQRRLFLTATSAAAAAALVGVAACSPGTLYAPTDTPATETVRAWLAAMSGGIPSIIAAARRLCAPTVTWKSSGFPDLHGVDGPASGGTNIADYLNYTAKAGLFIRIDVTGPEGQQPDLFQVAPNRVLAHRLDTVVVNPLPASKDPAGRWQANRPDGLLHLPFDVMADYTVSGDRIEAMVEDWDPRRMLDYVTAVGS